MVVVEIEIVTTEASRAKCGRRAWANSTSEKHETCMAAKKSSRSVSTKGISPRS